MKLQRTVAIVYLSLALGLGSFSVTSASEPPDTSALRLFAIPWDQTGQSVPITLAVAADGSLWTAAASGRLVHYRANGTVTALQDWPHPIELQDQGLAATTSGPVLHPRKRDLSSGKQYRTPLFSPQQTEIGTLQVTHEGNSYNIQHYNRAKQLLGEVHIAGYRRADGVIVTLPDLLSGASGGSGITLGPDGAAYILIPVRGNAAVEPLDNFYNAPIAPPERIEVWRFPLSLAAHTSLQLGTIVPEYPLPSSNTSTPAQPWTLEQLTRAADGIAEVQVDPSDPPDPQNHWYTGYVTVVRWLKQPTEVTTSRLPLHWPPWVQPHIPPDFQPGAHFVLFFNHKANWGSIEGWHNRYSIHPTGRVAEGIAPGLFALQDGRIAYAGIGQYQGWSATQFESAIRKALGQAVPVANDPDPTGLVALAQRSALIADADVAYEDAAAGRYFYTMSTRRWIKQPFQILGLPFYVSHGKNAIDSSKPMINMAERADHLIIFKTDAAQEAMENGSAIYGINDGVIVSESFLDFTPQHWPHSYIGWQADQFIAEVYCVVDQECLQTLSASSRQHLPSSGSPLNAWWIVACFLGSMLSLGLGIQLRQSSALARNLPQ